METLEFVIYPDGRVEEKVTGTLGSNCAELTAAIERELGIIAHRELTSEYFAAVQAESACWVADASAIAEWPSAS